MRAHQSDGSIRREVQVLSALVLAVTLGACGAGTGGGPGPEGEGQGLVLVAFNLNGLDNVPINTRLKLTFSEAVDPASVLVTDSSDPAYRKGIGSIQIREGDAFGRTVSGSFAVDGVDVYFEPDLPGLCDLSDAGLLAGTAFRVSVIGYPEALAIRNTKGQPLETTRTYEFTTLPESDPDYLQDAVPGQLPVVSSSEPEDGSAAVPVVDGNEIRVVFSENLDPCSVTDQTVRLFMAEIGDPNSFLDAGGGTRSGFSPVEDAAPGDPYSWGSALPHTTLAPLQRIPATLTLNQSFDGTLMRVVPDFGRFPENALLVLDLGGTITDLGGYPLASSTISFTTENLEEQETGYVVENEGETPYVVGITTADVNTVRSPGLAQGFMLVSGDGDNGTQQMLPSSPEIPPDCVDPRDANDGVLDEFDATGDTILDTGATLNTCPNSVDGSNAVVWEFSRFTIHSGATVTVIGVNPAIILVAGPVEIQSGGMLVVDGLRGEDGNDTTSRDATPPPGATGGAGIAGGGKGGDSIQPPPLATYPDPDPAYGEDGWAGAGSPDYPDNGPGGQGGGQGNTAVEFCVYPPTVTGASSGSGGGAGHAAEGGSGTAIVDSLNCRVETARGGGGEPYPDGPAGTAMLQPSAGSGGGAAGYTGCDTATGLRQGGCFATGGAGGGGGGFLDITSAGGIKVQGTISARGGRGGNGGLSYFVDTGDTGGGGGGSGGGIRLLTPGSIDITGGTLTTAGGDGGTGYSSCYTNGCANPNHGGVGSAGRIVLEDGDGVMTGQSSAILLPAEGDDGFYRNKFNASRFTGGGRQTVAVSEPFLVGAFDPGFIPPPEDDAPDFIAGIPANAAADPGTPQMVVEAQGYQMKRDGSADQTSATGWRTVGYFTNTGGPTEPAWKLGQVPGALRPPDNTLPWGFANLDTCEYIQIRITFVMGPNASVSDPGPYIDRWTIRFRHDQ